ncbi:SASB hydrolase, partial [Acromyrmex charruanus]
MLFSSLFLHIHYVLYISIISEIKVQIAEGKLIGVVVDGYNVRYFAFCEIPSHTKCMGNEDCLYLNIHGGGFIIGSGDAAWYGPDYIVQKDVVLVILNYRLGVLGTFSNFNNKVATGNQSLKDVILALKWIQKNILKFGGDPGNITIFGESAGGAIKHCLALTPLAKAFHEWTDYGFRLAKKLGKATSDLKVAYEFLKTIDPKILTKNSQWPICTEAERLSFTFCFTPSLDTKSPNPVFPKHLKEYINHGIQVPFLLGFTRNEGIFMLCSDFFGAISKEDLGKVNADFKKAILSNVLSELPKIGITVEELRSLYFGKREISEETLINYAYFLGDEYLIRDIMNVCELQKSSGGYKSTYLYHFDYESETSLMKKVQRFGLSGVSYGEDLFFLFCSEVAKAMNLSLPKPGTDDYMMINYFTQMWTNFAKTSLLIMSIKCISIEELKVQVNEGKLIGVIVDGYNVRYLAFRGIPYAKPPVGELRFKDPVPPEPWSGYRDASKYGNIAIQTDLRQIIIGDEDCLYLNVYTTKIELSKKRPVMVWIHGGAYISGSGDDTIYGPDYIVQKDVILVTLNYRLGVMGFLNLNDEVAAGNQGLKDVVLALKWVQNNILQFGGDPGNVTIFGGSAGGAIVHCLALSPLAKGLFHKVISQSGVILNPWAFNERTDIGFRLVRKLGKETSDPKVAYEFLKTIDAKTLTKNSQRSIFTETERLSFISLSLFTPTLDTKSPNPFFPEHPREYISRGIQMPFILGFNRNEGIFLLKGIVFGDINDKDLRKINTDFRKAILPNTLSRLFKMGITVEKLKTLYFKGKAISEETLTNFTDFLGDQFFVCDIMEVCEMQKFFGGYNSTYLYHFDYNSETFMKRMLNIKVDEGVCHGEDLGFLFCPEAAKMLNLSLPEPGSDNYKVVNYFTQMWTDFAKTGNPTPTTNLWLPISGPKNKGYNYLNIDLNLQMKTFQKEKARWNWENCKKHSNIPST